MCLLDHQVLTRRLRQHEYRWRNHLADLWDKGTRGREASYTLGKLLGDPGVIEAVVVGQDKHNA